MSAFEITHGMKRHPLSALFPSMPEAELLELSEDIKRTGQRDAVVVFEGMILDGWHRMQACQLAGVPCKARDFPANGDAVAYVKSKNLHRRSLDAGQRAVAVVKLAEWRSAGRPSASEEIPHSVRNIPTTRQLAEEAAVSERTIEQAKAAVRNGRAEAVTNGQMSVRQAARKPDSPEKPKAPSKIDQAEQTITDLQETIAAVVAELEAARNELNALRLATAEEEERAAYIRTLQEEMNSLRTTNEDHKHTINAHIRQIKALQKRLKDAGLE